jgi:outer membrane protein assembly factor BamB
MVPGAFAVMNVFRIRGFAGLVALFFSSTCVAADQPQLASAWGRNFVSAETNLPVFFDPASGSNVLWVADLGTESHATPVIANGRVYVGGNNGRPRDARRAGDRGVLFCLAERTGKLLWQLAIPKLTGDIFLDWPRAGICSPPTVESNRVYIVSNRGEALCLDAEGMANGNDGPFVDEAALMTPKEPDAAKVEMGPLDADVLWRFDMASGAGIWTHDSAHTSILIRGDHLYLNTGTGVDNTHKVIRSPDAPSLIALDKRTGKMIARERERIAPDIFHATWSCPALGMVNGTETVVFAGGNGTVYGFRPAGLDATSETLEKLWSFYFDPDAPRTNIHDYLGNRHESPSVIHGMPVFEAGRLFVAGGGDLWWGKTNAWIKCYRTDAVPPREIWSRALDGHVVATPSVAAGMVFIGDCDGVVHCVDTETGAALWTHKTKGEIWGSALVADGKVYVGTRSGSLLIFGLSREKKLLNTVEFKEPMSATPVAANGTIFISTAKRLCASR